MPQKYILFSMLLMAGGSVLAADATQTNSATATEQTVQKADQAGQSAENTESQAKAASGLSKRSRVDQESDNVQQSINTAQDLFQGDHN